MFKKLITGLKLAKNSQHGFNLSELLVAVSIISLLAAYPAAGKYESSIKAARDAQRKYNTKQVESALYLYYDDHNQYPTFGNDFPTVYGWQELSKILEGRSDENMDSSGLYMPKAPIDPLDKNEYVFKYWSDGQKFSIEYETEDSSDASPQIIKGY
jgi:prepilin-type N-terminal cleavage/methylation domain-containing protein